MTTKKPASEQPSSDLLESIRELLRISDFGLSAESIRCIINRRGDPKVQHALEWMLERREVISRPSRVGKIEIWELKTPGAVRRAEVRFR